MGAFNAVHRSRTSVYNEKFLFAGRSQNGFLRGHFGSIRCPVLRGYGVAISRGWDAAAAAAAHDGGVLDGRHR